MKFLLSRLCDMERGGKSTAESNWERGVVMCPHTHGSSELLSPTQVLLRSGAHTSSSMG